MLECGFEHGDVVRGADVAQRRRRVAREPRSFARFIGEPLNAALNSSCVIASTSRAKVRASLPAMASRGANVGSLKCCAKRTFDGQTSWDVSRYTRFVIPLETGRNALPGRRRK